MLSAFQTLRVAVLCSSRAPGLEVLLHHPHHRSLYDIAGVLTTETDFPDRREIETAGVPVFVHPIHVFHSERQASIRDLAARHEYDTVTAEALRHLGVNVVVLLSYRFILTEPMLRQFEHRIIGVHDSDLTIDRPDGKRKYVGLHSTRDAIVAGEKETRSAVHLVTREIDGGPIVLMSEPFPVAPFAADAAIAGAIDVVNAYAWAHREWMMRKSWGDLVVRALEHMSAGMETLDLESVL